MTPGSYLPAHLGGLTSRSSHDDDEFDSAKMEDYNNDSDQSITITGSTSEDQEDETPSIAPSEPGAYSVQNGIASRAESVALTMFGDDGDGNATEVGQEDETETATDANFAAIPHSIVVAAELTSDAESEIEDKVRRRLLKETTKASVILVEPIDEAIDKELFKHRNVKERLFGDTRQTPNISAASDR